ncbi:hypothetical protein Y032_0026g1436 [Ancylostoma ceylanicum]|uniref:Uncharacterized protein n=1 Tax=Ancylostoma ceylanicum TaxID=53326 RepID=A0A016UVS8_9BILA|nr:hypothetical protein Y032_0026g1436 [Ancylostoma ceylanicum]
MADLTKAMLKPNPLPENPVDVFIEAGSPGKGKQLNIRLITVHDLGTWSVASRSSSMKESVTPSHGGATA